jgi:hypothetical protein
VSKIHELETSPKEKGKTIREYVKENKNSCIRFTQTNAKEVEKILRHFDIKKAIGLDQLHTQTIVDAADILAPFIAHIFNLSIKAGVFPDALKHARVSPLFKKGDPFLTSNYRPVSVLLTLSKVFERIILNQLMQFLERNEIMSAAQYGFLKKVSTKTALVNFHEHVLSLLDNKGTVGLGVFIDLAKAFDTVNHTILLEKLALYGLQKNALALLASYLSNRTQVVIIDGVKSKPMKITCGVPQGSILGPLLFILYINDLPNCLTHAKPFIFADDTNLFLHMSNN